MSGYPNLEEAYWFGEGVLPLLEEAGHVATPAVEGSEEAECGPPSDRDPPVCSGQAA